MAKRPMVAGFWRGLDSFGGEVFGVVIGKRGFRRFRYAVFELDMQCSFCRMARVSPI